MHHRTKVWWTIQDILWHSFTQYSVFVDFSRHTSAKNEKWPAGCCANCRLYQNMPNLVINYESVSARPLFRLNPQSDPSTLYSYNPNVVIFVIKKSCPIVVDKNASIHKAKKHLASCATCKTGISTLSLRINEHPYCIRLCYVKSTDTCAQIYCVSCQTV